MLTNTIPVLVIEPSYNHRKKAKDALETGLEHDVWIATYNIGLEILRYGDTKVITPNIDAFAGSGTVFTHSYAQLAICNPSRTSVMTGLRPDTSGVVDNVKYFRDTHPNLVTIPQYFAKHGYQTVKTGKIFHCGNDDKHSFQKRLHEWAVPGVSSYNDPENVKGYEKRLAEIRKREAAGEKFTAHDRYVSLIGPASECADVPDNVRSHGRDKAA